MASAFPYLFPRCREPIRLTKLLSRCEDDMELLAVVRVLHDFFFFPRSVIDLFLFFTRFDVGCHVTRPPLLALLWQVLDSFWEQGWSACEALRQAVASGSADEMSFHAVRYSPYPLCCTPACHRHWQLAHTEKPGLP